MGRGGETILQLTVNKRLIDRANDGEDQINGKNWSADGATSWKEQSRSSLNPSARDFGSNQSLGIVGLAVKFQLQDFGVENTTETFF
jgi:hypothetical protein